MKFNVLLDFGNITVESIISIYSPDCTRISYVDHDNLNSQRSTCLCFPGSGVNGMHHQTRIGSQNISTGIYFYNFYAINSY